MRQAKLFTFFTSTLTTSNRIASIGARRPIGLHGHDTLCHIGDILASMGSPSDRCGARVPRGTLFPQKLLSAAYLDTHRRTAASCLDTIAVEGRALSAHTSLDQADESLTLPPKPSVPL